MIKYIHLIVILILCILLAKLYLSTDSYKKPNNKLLSINNNIDKEEQKPKRKIVLYFASWCGHCNNFKPVWNEFKNIAMEKFPNLVVKDIQCDSEDNKYLCSNIEGYPTVLLDDTIEYDGNRTVDSLVSFIMKN